MRKAATQSKRFRSALEHIWAKRTCNTFGKGFSWITAPEFDVATLRDIGIQHEVTVAEGYQTTVELMNATSDIKYGDNHEGSRSTSRGIPERVTTTLNNRHGKRST